LTTFISGAGVAQTSRLSFGDNPDYSWILDHFSGFFTIMQIVIVIWIPDLKKSIFLNLLLRFLGGDYGGTGGNPSPKYILLGGMGDAKASVPPTIATFSKKIKLSPF